MSDDFEFEVTRGVSATGSATRVKDLEATRQRLRSVLELGALPSGLSAAIERALSENNQASIEMLGRTVGHVDAPDPVREEEERLRRHLTDCRVSPFLEGWQRDIVDQGLVAEGADALNTMRAAEAMLAIDVRDHAIRTLRAVGRGTPEIPPALSQRAAAVLAKLEDEAQVLAAYREVAASVPAELVRAALADPLCWSVAAGLPHGWDTRRESLVFSSGPNTFAWLPGGIVDSLLGLADTDFVSSLNVRKFVDYMLRFAAAHEGLVQCTDERAAPGAWPLALVFHLGHRDNRTREPLYGICVENRRKDSSRYVFKFQTREQLTVRSAFLDDVGVPPVPADCLPPPPDFRALALRGDPTLDSFFFNPAVPLLGEESNFRHLHSRVSRVEGLSLDDLTRSIEHSFWRVRCQPHLATPQWNRQDDSTQLLVPLFPAPRAGPRERLRYVASEPEEPLGAMVVSLADGEPRGYRIATLLSMIDAFNNAKLVAHTPPSWLHRGIRRQLGMDGGAAKPRRPAAAAQRHDAADKAFVTASASPMASPPPRMATLSQGAGAEQAFLDLLAGGYESAKSAHADPVTSESQHLSQHYALRPTATEWKPRARD